MVSRYRLGQLQSWNYCKHGTPLSCLHPRNNLRTMTSFPVGIFCIILLWTAEAFLEVPKFSQLQLLYPGYYMHGGTYRDLDVLDLIGCQVSTPSYEHETASARLSWTLNRYGGPHSIGTVPVLLSKRGRDSCTGKDGVEYIYRNTAFGPFLASRYGNPTVFVRLDSVKNISAARDAVQGRQGIMRLVGYRPHHPDGHVGLWDCDRFYQSRDWTEVESHVIAVELWEAPDSFCPPKKSDVPPPVPHLQAANRNLTIVVVHDHAGQSRYLHVQRRTHGERKHHGDTLWLQNKPL